MKRHTILMASVLAILLVSVHAPTTAAADPAKKSGDDYGWVKGANYIPSYAGTDIEIWHRFNPYVIDRELGYAESIGLNSVRMFLSYHAYEVEPERFLRNVERFVGLCDKHGIRPMLVVFDGCFGVSPSLNNTEFWVASPGPDRTNPDFYPDGEKYCKALVDLFRDDNRVLIWDVMNEPMSTWLATEPGGHEQIVAFARHFLDYMHKIGVTQPLTIGDCGEAGNAQLIDHMDVFSIHTYAKTEEELQEKISQAREMAHKAGVPWLISETCAPDWNCHYEMVMPILRQENVGYYWWEVMIGKTVFTHVAGMFYPDGTVRRLSELEAVMGKKPEGFEEKPDSEGEPYGQPEMTLPQRLNLVYTRMTKYPTDEENFRERYTLLVLYTKQNRGYGEVTETLIKELAHFDELIKAGNTDRAFPKMDSMLQKAYAAWKEHNDVK